MYVYSQICLIIAHLAVAFVCLVAFRRLRRCRADIAGGGILAAGLNLVCALVKIGDVCR